MSQPYSKLEQQMLSYYLGEPDLTQECAQIACHGDPKIGCIPCAQADLNHREKALAIVVLLVDSLDKAALIGARSVGLSKLRRMHLSERLARRIAAFATDKRRADPMKIEEMQ
jgi:hypothetical protein